MPKSAQEASDQRQKESLNGEPKPASNLPAAALVVQKVSEIAAPVLIEMGLELVEIQYRREMGRLMLRLFVDRQLIDNSSNEAGSRADESAPKPLGSGVTLDDCAKLSRELGFLLEVAEIIPGKYVLEVSSPGLDRLLRYPDDFIRFKGREIKVKKAGGQVAAGLLIGLDEAGNIHLQKKDESIVVERSSLVSARLTPQIDWPKRKVKAKK